MLSHSIVARMVMGSVLMFLTTSMVLGQTATQGTTPAKKPAAKKGNDAQEERIEAAIYKALKEQFKKEDINNNGYLEKSELITWLGLVYGPEMLKKFDKDSSGTLTLDEFDEWAKEYADKYAKWFVEEEEKAEAELARLQAAYAKASQQARQQYQQAIERQRDQLERLRDRRRLNDRLRDLQRRRR